MKKAVQFFILLMIIFLFSGHTKIKNCEKGDTVKNKKLKWKNGQLICEKGKVLDKWQVEHLIHILCENKVEFCEQASQNGWSESEINEFISFALY